MIVKRCRIGRLLMVVSLCSLASCTTVVTPPAQVTEPAKIAILDHGRHASLIVEVPDEPAMIRYAYGDWQWYALRQTGVIEATRAVLWPSQAAMGRKRIAQPFSSDAIMRSVRVGIENAVYLEVEAASVRALISRLDGIRNDYSATYIYNAAYDLEFVHHPDAYWIFHNSNHMVGQWLAELGCRVDGPMILSDWQRDTPSAR